MSQYYARHERERDYGSGDGDYDPEEYANHPYQRVPRVPRNNSTFSPPATPNYEFSRQHTWPGQNGSGSGGGSYEERERGFQSREFAREREREYDGYSASPRTPTYEARGGPGSSSAGGGGASMARRKRDSRDSRDSRDIAGSPRYEMRNSPRQRETERERDRNGEDRDFYQRREKMQDCARQRMRNETKNYPRRLRTYLLPILQSQTAMDHAVEVFVKLDEDARYLTRSASTLLESLAAVADDIANNIKGGDGTGLDDPPTDSELTEESALEDSETAAESANSDDDDNAADFGDSRRPGSSRDNGGSIIGAARRRSSAAAPSAKNGDGQRKGSMSAAPLFMQWSDFSPHALNKAPDGVNDRRKSFLALTQTIGVSLLTLDMEAASLRGKSGSSQLSTKGLLSELVRVLQPHDYRAYFRAAARVVLLPNTGLVRRPDEIALEAMERQLLGTAKFGSAMPGATASGSAAAGAAPMVACLTYSSGNYGAITLYRLDMVSTREGGDWPRRIQPVSAMTGVPKELLRRSVRAMPPSRRTVLKLRSAGSGVTGNGGSSSSSISSSSGGNGNKGDRSSSGSGGGGGGGGESSRLRWVSLPGDATAPSLGYSPNVGRAALSGSLRTALGIEPDDLKLAGGSSANIVNATVPAMLAWLHVRAAYLTGVEFEATEVQRGSSGSKSSTKERERERDRDRDRDRDDTASSASVPQRPRMRRIVRCKRGPTAIEHEGRDPCIVVLHPSRGDWVTAPVYWTEVKE